MRDKIRSHHSIAELAAEQHGVVSTPQLRALGFSRSAVAGMAHSGQLHRIHRGVYAVGHVGLSKHGRCLGAVLACGSDALLSHDSAAWLWGLTRGTSQAPHVSVPRTGHARPSMQVHHAPALRTVDRGAVDGIPVTAIPRTLLDLASCRPPLFLERTIESAERMGLFDLRAIDSLLAHASGHRGAGRLRRALGTYREPAFTRSELERRFLALVREANLPVPSVNLFVAGYELDMYWPEERFAVELDGYGTHGTRAAFERDRTRQEDLKLAGIEMVRITYRRIESEPKAIAKRLRRLLAQRREQGTRT